MDRIELPLVICSTGGKVRNYNHGAIELMIRLFNDADEKEVLFNLENFLHLHISTKDFAKSGLHMMNKRIRFIQPGGKQFFFLLVIFPLKNEKSETDQILVSISDITEERIFSDSLREAAKNVESVLYSATPRGDKFLLMTEASQKLFGYSPAEIIRNSRLLTRQINYNDFLNFKTFLYELREGKNSVVEYKIKNKSGETLYLRNSAFPVLQAGVVIKIDGVISDITKEVAAKIELEKSEERFRLLIESANDLIFNLNKSGYFTSVNTNGALALGYAPKDMVGKHFLDFVNPNNKIEVAQAFQKILKSDEVVVFETVFINKFGEDIICEIHCRPLKDDQAISGVLGFGRNITEKRLADENQKQLYAKLVEANRLILVERDRARQQVSVLEQVNKLKSEFISNVSHELRTPLASIVGFSETISSDPDLSKDLIMEFNEIILSESKRLARLINDFLDFAKMEAGKMDLVKSDFDGVELLLSVIQKLRPGADEKGVKISAEIPGKPIQLYGDRERIEQVYNHLVTNAIKFTDKGGRVSIIAQEFPREFEVIITDTGIGVAEKDIERIFQKFFKVENPGTTNTGTGIGLGLIKQIVDLHGGLITVQSEEKKGTTFVVKLPKKIEINK